MFWILAHKGSCVPLTAKHVLGIICMLCFFVVVVVVVVGLATEMKKI